MKIDSQNAAPDLDRIIADLLEGVPPIVTTKRSAEILGVSFRTVQRWIDRGQLAVLRTNPGGGGRILVPRAEIERRARLMLS